MRKLFARFAPLLMVLSTLLACGGGGGGSPVLSNPSATPTPGPAPTSAPGITSSPGPTVSPTPSTPIPLTGTQVQNLVLSANTAHYATGTITVEAIDGEYYVRNLPQGSGDTRTGSAFPNTTASGGGSTLDPVCDLGGSYNASWNIGSNTEFTIGDTVSFIYTGCKKSGGVTYNGTATYTVVSSSKDRLAITAAFSAFTSKSGLDTLLSLSDNTLGLVRTTGADGVYPHTYTLSGSLEALVAPGSTVGNLVTGNYNISNANFTLNFSSATVTTAAANFSVNDGSRAYTVNNTTPITMTSGTVTTNGVNQITGYQNATVTVTSGPSSSAITGVNADGSAISSSIAFTLFN